MSAGAVRPFGVEAQRVLRLEKGHAIIAQDTDNLTNPFEAGMGWAVRMGKPFFVGQRSLRIHVRRGPRQKLVAFEVAADPASPAPAIAESNLLLQNGNIAGRVTSLAHSPTLGRLIGFAMAAPHLSEPGTSLVIRSSDGRHVAARVVRAPFVEAGA
jgi:sarcosine oxidase subunit alpha